MAICYSNASTLLKESNLCYEKYHKMAEKNFQESLNLLNKEDVDEHTYEQDIIFVLGDSSMGRKTFRGISSNKKRCEDYHLSKLQHKNLNRDFHERNFDNGLNNRIDFNIIEKYFINNSHNFTNLITSEENFEISDDNILQVIQIMTKGHCNTEELKCIPQYRELSENILDRYINWLRYKNSSQTEVTNIWELEEYLQWANCVPIYEASYRLGVTIKTLSSILNVISKYLIFDHIYYSNSFIYSDIIENIYKYLLIDYIPDNLDEYNNSIYKKIKDFEINIENKKCETSKILDNEPLNSNCYDNITGEALNSKYAIMLDFNKPIFLKPCICSLKTYVKYEELLKKYLIGPQISEENYLKIKELI